MSATPAQIDARIAEALVDEADQPPVTWWLSFAEDGFRGVVLVDAPGLTSAMLAVHRAKVSPGGEVQGLPITREMAIAADRLEMFEATPRLRLLSIADLERYGWEPGRAPVDDPASPRVE